MYSREEKIRAVELFIRYDLSPASVIRELGYPCRATLYAWHEEYLANGCDMPSASNHRRYTEEQRRAAVDHFFEHGRCLAVYGKVILDNLACRNSTLWQRTCRP